LKETIRQGITLQGKWNFISFIFISAGFAIMLDPLLLRIGTATVILLIPVFLSVRGTDINYSKKTIRKWTSWYGIKTGKTISFDDYEFVELRNYYSCHTMGCQSVNGTYTARTFEIWIGGNGKTKILITEIPGYGDARLTLERICSESGLQMIDSYEKIILRAMKTCRRND
jgi:hypothetical protein